jgi:hypothetical protein
MYFYSFENMSIFNKVPGEPALIAGEYYCKQGHDAAKRRKEGINGADGAPRLLKSGLKHGNI